MLLAASLAVFAYLWALWLVYMVRYPDRWSAHVDRHRQLLLSYGINLPQMHRAERGWILKTLVAFTVLITLLGSAILLQHPSALQDFWHDLQHVNLRG